MNMFYLDDDFKLSAQYHVDKHVIKIILETTQLLSNCFHFYGLSEHSPYKPTHMSHPMSIWVRESRANYKWACSYGLALCDEYTYRYGKEHKCEQYLRSFNDRTVWFISNLELTPFPLCMPDYCKLTSPIDSYRNYYNLEKSHLFSWKSRNSPSWINY